MILSHRSRRVSNLRKKSPDGHCLTGAFLYWNQWAGLFGHKGIESLGFRGHLTLDFPRYTQGENISTNRLDGYSDHSLSASRDFKIRNINTSLSLEVLNLLDKNYEIIKNFPMPGRSVRATLKVTY